MHRIIFSRVVSAVALLFLFSAAFSPVSARAAGVREVFYNVRDYGAAGDGKALETQPIQRAIDEASAAGGGTVYFPPGKYLSGRLFTKNSLTLFLEAGAVILGSADLADFPETIPAFRSYTDNYVRTALMYALMKSQGCWLENWREDLRLGAVSENESLLIVLEAEKPWRGLIRFDYPRHKAHFNMSVNYPRLNEFPEWYTVESDRLYAVSTGQEKQIFAGAELVRGLELALEPGQMLSVRVQPWQQPPYGKK